MGGIRVSASYLVGRERGKVLLGWEHNYTLAFCSTFPLLVGRREGLLFLISAAQLTGTKCSGAFPFGLFPVSCRRGKNKCLETRGAVTAGDGDAVRDTRL